MRIKRWTVALAGILALASVVEAVAAPPPEPPRLFPQWQLGAYWTYQGRVRVGAEEALVSHYTVTYYLVARENFLYMVLCALAEVTRLASGDERLAPLLIHPLYLALHPGGWPLPALRTPRERGVAVLLPVGALLPEPGGWQTWETAFPNSGRVTVARYRLAGEAVEEVTVPAGTFPQTQVIFYQRSLGELMERGRAWWSEEVGWWVKLEGQTQTSDGAPTYYTLELVDWGQLSWDELTARLTQALRATEEALPEVAALVRIQLSQVGIELPGPK